MSFLIRLFYENKIRDEVKDYVKKTDATDLNTTVNEIFKKYKWTGFLESAKKSAIKDILKDELKEEKETMRPRLMQEAENIMKNQKLTLPNDAKNLITELRKIPELAIYSPNEIRYYLLISSALKKSLIKLDKKKLDQKEAVHFHNEFIEDLKGNKEFFHELTKIISNKTGKTQEEIDRECYRVVFNKESTGLKYKKVLKALQTVPRDQRLNAYRKMKDFAGLIENTKALSKQDVDTFNEISSGTTKEDDKTTNLSKYVFFFGQLVKQVEEVKDNPFYGPVVMKLMEAFESKFKILTLENNRTPENFRQILEELSKKPFKNLDTICANAPNAPNATNINTFRQDRQKKGEGPQNFTNLKELIPLLYKIPTDSAKRIQEFLNDPSKKELASKEDQANLLLLHQIATTINDIYDIDIFPEMFNWKILGEYLPKRDQPGIDKKIVMKLYELKKDLLFVKVFANPITEAFTTYHQNAEHFDLMDANKRDIEYGLTPVEFPGLKIPGLQERKFKEKNIHGFIVNEIFSLDCGRGSYNIKPLNSKEDIPIPFSSEETTISMSKTFIPVAEDEEEVALTPRQALSFGLNLFAQGDDKLFSLLQTISSQSVLTPIVLEVGTKLVYSVLGLPEGLLTRFKLDVDNRNITFQYLTPTSIKAVCEFDLLLNDISRKNAKNEYKDSLTKKITANIILNKNEKGEWVSGTPECEITDQSKDEQKTKGTQAANLLGVKPDTGTPPAVNEGKEEMTDEEYKQHNP